MRRKAPPGRGVRGIVTRNPGDRRRPLACWALLALALACSDGPTAPAPEGVVDLSAPWAARDPGDVGMDGPSLVAASEQAAAVNRFRSLLVVRSGALVLERYFGNADASSPADVRSVTKSVVSILTGAALERGDLRSLDQPIGEILGPPTFQLSGNQAAVTVRHLLSMTAGFSWGDEAEGAYNEWILAPDPVAYLLDQPIVTEPGTSFHYNSAAVHLLGVVLEEATGRSLPTFADQVLFAGLGIGDRDWEALPGGRVNGGSGIDLRPRDLARIGQLMLQEGYSGNRIVIPSGWVREATATRFGWSVQVGPLSRVSYGFLWWTDLDRGAFFAWGYGGQFVYVDPGEEIVVVTTTDWRGISGETGPRPLEEAALDVIHAVLEAIR